MLVRGVKPQPLEGETMPARAVQPWPPEGETMPARTVQPWLPEGETMPVCSAMAYGGGSYARIDYGTLLQRALLNGLTFNLSGTSSY